MACFLLSSCRSSRNMSKNGVGGIDFRQLARAGLALGFDIDEMDDWPLMIESAQWLGVPYKYAGNTKNGVDCSGLNCEVYKKVYRIQLHRNSKQQYEKDCHSVSLKKLQSGDLVFFAPDAKKKNINHTGIYLKDSKFIHASSSKGVVVSSLMENYYSQRFVAGGRVK